MGEVETSWLSILRMLSLLDPDALWGLVIILIVHWLSQPQLQNCDDDEQ